MFNPAQEMSSISFDKIIGGTLNAVVSAQNESSLTTVNFIKEVGFENDENGRAVKPVYVEFKYPKEIAPYQPGREEYFTFQILNGGSGYNEDELNNGAASVTDDGVKLRFSVDSNGAINSVTVLEGTVTEKTVVKLDGLGGEDAQIKPLKHKEVAATPAVYKDMTLQVPLLTIVPIPFIRIATTDLEFNVKINSMSNSENSSSTDVNASTSASVKGGVFVRTKVNINASVSHQQKKSETEQVQKEYSLNVKIHAVQDDMPVGMSRILDILEESIVPKDSAPKQVSKSTEENTGNT